jgi:hypothetical protein
MKKLREGKKRDYRMKTAKLIVRDALRIRGVIVTYEPIEIIRSLWK